MSALLAAWRRALLAGLTSLLLGVGFVAPASALADTAPVDPANPVTPATVTADPLPTVQINGVAWAQVVVGNTVYVAGKFTRARPAGAAPGTQETVRNNLLAYDVRTGALVTSFAPDLNGQARALAASPDGSRVYVGGDFTSANGQPRSRIAAYDTATGQLVTSFRPAASSTVQAIAATNSTVYLGGDFASVGSVARTRLAAVSAVNGALLPWAPRPGVGPTAGNTLPNNPRHNASTSSSVLAMVVAGTNGQVVVAGRFDSLNGTKATGVGAIDGATGATRPFAVNALITNQGVNSAVWSLSTDGTMVYGTGYNYYGPGNLEGSFAAAANGGAVRWINDCHGDTYSAHAMGGVVYHATHAHACHNIGGFPEQTPQVNLFATALSQAAAGTVGTATLKNQNFAGKPAPSVLPWYPTFTSGTFTQQFQAGWSVTGNKDYVVYGGEFPTVNGTRQQGLVRFAVPSLAPDRVAPRATGTFAPTVGMIPGAVRVSWRAVHDRDNEHLTYRVYRDSETGTPVCQVTRPSQWWDLPTYACTDTGAPAGSHRYLVVATDPAGNRLASTWATATVGAANSSPDRAYGRLVATDGAVAHWPLGETSGATAFDRVGTRDLTVNAGVTRNQAGAIAGDPNRAFAFNGTSTGFLASSTATLAPQTFSVEAWFQTTSSAGGKIVGYGNAPTGLSARHDRNVFMDTAGRVHFGVWTGARELISTSDAYNDGRWHHVVGTLSRAGLSLYVDGQLIGTRSTVTSADSYSGYWRVGGDRSWSGSAWFAGRIDEVAVYPTALPAERVEAHLSTGRTGAAPNVAPTASFTATAADLTVALDATSSRDVDGTVVSYAWDFGDGTTGTGTTVEHVYAVAGSYAVTLQVTDDDGATARRTTSVTVTDPPPNVPPTAAFGSQTSGLAVSVDAAGSSDPDGSVVGYAWDFGDGATGSGASAAHTYAEAGTYTVTLTVTDDDGATGSVVQPVTVVASSGPLAADAFGREVAAGWGAADVGGAWTIGGGTANAAVTGGAGQLTGAAGRTMRAVLAGVSQQDVAVQADVVLPEATTGAGTFVSLGARRVGSSNYLGTLGVRADGSMFVRLDRAVNGVETTLGARELALRHVPGEAVTVRFETSGAATGTTTLQVKAWAAGTAEPAAWTLSRTDSTAELQRPGALSVETYTSATATSPSVVRLDDLWAGSAGQAPPLA